MENELLKMENVSKSYLEDGGGDLLILRDINLTIKKGDAVSLPFFLWLLCFPEGITEKSITPDWMWTRFLLRTLAP